MRSDRWVLVVAAALGGAAAVGACSDSFTTAGSISPPDSVGALPLGMRTIAVRWVTVPGAISYRVERRANLQGPFATVRDVSGFLTAFTDEALDPETTYGYRVRAISAAGIVSEPSLVAGARTAPVPGIVAVVATTPADLAGQDGYAVVVAGSRDTLRAPLAAQDQHRFSPLHPGPYAVVLSGLTANCTVADGAERTDTVTDQGLATLRYVSFSVQCRDPSVGHLSVRVATTGDSLDADGYVLTLSGTADDATLPDSLRAYFRRETVGVQALRPFDLRPGDYTLQLSGIAGNCTLQGPATQDARIDALGDVSRSFTVQCRAADDPTHPLVWRNAWSALSAPEGQPVLLEVGLDLRAQPGQDVNAAQATLEYDSAVVRLDTAIALSPRWTPAYHVPRRGLVNWQVFTTNVGLTDSVAFMQFRFTVVGDPGATTTTLTKIQVASNFNGDNLIPLIRRVESTLTVDAGAANLPPVARPGGPYSGTAGATITFSGAASSDPDGTIASYGWSFGDGASATGVAPIHAYAAAGPYTVTLTVTDNGGLTGNAQTTATVSGGGGGNQPPIAVPNGPYSGSVGTPVSFSAAGSSDPDGAINSYAWDFGDGATASGATATHTYGSAGTFTVRLTVTDNLDATSTATTTATVSSGGGGTKPFTWRNEFGPITPADSLVTLTILLDLSTDIAQTAGSEALDSWRVDSLRWNPAVLRYFAFNFGPGGAGSVNPTDAARGKLVFSGVQGASNNSGVMTIATIKFKVIGAPGAATSTLSALGSLLGTPSTGTFSYGPLTAVQEGAILVP